MPYINIDTTILRNRKFKKFKRFLEKDDQLAFGYLATLWINVLELAEDGDISKWSEEDIAEYAGFNGEPAKFFQALTVKDYALVDIIKGKRLIHGWLDFAGRYLDTKYRTNNPVKLEYIKSLYEEQTEISPTKVRPKSDNIREDKRKEDKSTYGTDIRFEEIWAKYPNKDGRKEALRHFRASVRNEKDWQDITIALEHYVADLKAKPWKNKKSGKVFFNNWRDWINPPDAPIKEKDKPKFDPKCPKKCDQGWHIRKKDGKGSPYKKCDCWGIR